MHSKLYGNSIANNIVSKMTSSLPQWDTINLWFEYDVYYISIHNSCKCIAFSEHSKDIHNSISQYQIISFTSFFFARKPLLIQSHTVKSNFFSVNLHFSTSTTTINLKKKNFDLIYECKQKGQIGKKMACNRMFSQNQLYTSIRSWLTFRYDSNE